jgi:hypothetical protein
MSCTCHIRVTFWLPDRDETRLYLARRFVQNCDQTLNPLMAGSIKGGVKRKHSDILVHLFSRHSATGI